MSKSPYETMADADMKYYDKNGELPVQYDREEKNKQGKGKDNCSDNSDIKD